MVTVSKIRWVSFGGDTAELIIWLIIWESIAIETARVVRAWRCTGHPTGTQHQRQREF